MMTVTTDHRVDDYIASLPEWQRDVCDPAGIITAGHDNKTARTVAVHRGETITAVALVEMLRAIVANNRAGGWRKRKRQAQ